VIQSLADRRAAFLYRAGGFAANNPPNLLRLARALLGDDALHFVGRHGERGALVTSLSGAGCRIYLHRGASVEENAFAIARGIARWDVDRGGPVTDAARLALSVALPFEVMESRYAAGRTSEQIASAHHLPVEIVRSREALLVEPASATRLRAAPAFVYVGASTTATVRGAS